MIGFNLAPLHGRALQVAPMSAVASRVTPREACCQCGAVRTDPGRPYYPLWFRHRDGRPVCPDCVPTQPQSPTLNVVVEATAVIVDYQKARDAAHA